MKWAPDDNGSLGADKWIFSLDEVEVALKLHLASRKQPSRHIDNVSIDIVKNSAVYHYGLETLAEGRKLAWKWEPCKDDFTENQTYHPGPWKIRVPRPRVYHNDEARMRIPESMSITTCQMCDGLGYYQCRKCHCAGTITCVLCKPENFEDMQVPDWCHCCNGEKKIVCFVCHGSRFETCSCCGGHKSIKRFVELAMEWTVYKDERVIEWTELPPELSDKECGILVLKEEMTRVKPLQNFPDEDIYHASKFLIAFHTSKTFKKQQTILCQRHTVIVIPVAEVYYTFKGKQRFCFLYGIQHKIYSPPADQPDCCSLF